MGCLGHRERTAGCDTGIGCSAPPAYQWNHLVLEFQRSSTQATFVSVTLNGNKSYINRTFNTYGVSASELNTAVQLDGDYNQEDYSMWVDKMQGHSLVIPLLSASHKGAPPGAPLCEKSGLHLPDLWLMGTRAQCPDQIFHVA